MLSCSGLGEKRVEGIITASSSLVTRHLPIRLRTGEKRTQPSDKTNKKRKGYKEPETRKTSKRLTLKMRRRTRNNFEENHRREAS
jgi:hypothetical protein